MVRRDPRSSNDPSDREPRSDAIRIERTDWTDFRASFANLMAEWSMLKAHLDQKANFNPAQLRVPAGQDGAGQWTSLGSVVVRRWSEDSSEGEPSDDDAAVRDDGIGTSRHDLISGPSPRAALEYAAALTGIERIDNATKTLCERLGEAMEVVDFLPRSTPQLYGPAVHVAFGALVRVSGISGIGPGDVETSFKGEGATGPYGDSGSIRTDVVLRNESGDIIAIYDLKTGNSGLSAARIRELRSRTNAGASVPVFEMNFRRNAVLRKDADQPIGTVTVVLSRA